jgi:hypothetical protein
MVKVEEKRRLQARGVPRSRRTRGRGVYGGKPRATGVCAASKDTLSSSAITFFLSCVFSFTFSSSRSHRSPWVTRRLEVTASAAPPCRCASWAGASRWEATYRQFWTGAPAIRGSNVKSPGHRHGANIFRHGSSQPHLAAAPSWHGVAVREEIQQAALRPSQAAPGTPRPRPELHGNRHRRQPKELFASF